MAVASNGRSNQSTVSIKSIKETIRVALTDTIPTQLKYGVMAHKERPNLRDITSVDGGFMYGYRKVRIKNGIGYVMAGGVSFGHKDLAQYAGQWVYVNASDYWATTAIIGYGKPSENIAMFGIKCGFLSDINE